MLVSLDLVNNELNPFQLVLRQLAHPLPQLLYLLLRRSPTSPLLQFRLHPRGDIRDFRCSLLSLRPQPGHLGQLFLEIRISFS